LPSDGEIARSKTVEFCSKRIKESAVGYQFPAVSQTLSEQKLASFAVFLEQDEESCSLAGEQNSSERSEARDRRPGKDKGADR
jgi:hypothetical protein